MLPTIHEVRHDEGFTLIELLVVVIIMGLLASIAIPVFLTQREKAWNSAARSDLRNAAVQQEAYFTDHSAYASKGDIVADGFKQSPNVTVTIIDADPDYYCMSALHVSGGSTWYLASTTGAPDTAACTTDGDGAQNAG